MRRHAKASSAAPTPRHGKSRGLFGLACLCVLGLTAFLGSGAPSAGAAEDPCPNAEFRQGFGSLLPDCRAYEKVSPNDKGGFDIGETSDPAGTSGTLRIPGGGLDNSTIASVDPINAGPVVPGGARVGYFAQGSFAGAPSGGLTMQQYIAERGADGWGTTPILHRFESRNTVYDARLAILSKDLSRSFFDSSFAIMAGDQAADPGLNKHYYLRDNFGGAVEKIAELNTAFPPRASAGLDHLVFATPEILTADPGQPVSARKIYDYSSGQLRLISRRPSDDAPFQTNAVLGGDANGAGQNLAGAVSDDGQHIYFTATDSSPTFAGIYRRTGAVTELASPSQRTPPDPNVAGAKRFKIATPDGERVFFTSAVKLTDDANSSKEDLYRYDFGSDQMINLSAGTAGGDPAEVLGVVDISASGDRAYFVATGQVVPGEGVTGQPNLYLWQEGGTPQGAVRYLTTLAPGIVDRDNWLSTSSSRLTAQAAADGEQLVFVSKANITGYDPLGTRQTYRYDATTDEIACLSCSAPPTGSSLPPFTGVFAGVAQPLFVSDDGSRVLFSSRQALLPGDTNGAWDAYLWDNGELFLLSIGTGDDDSFAWGMSASGDDVFFRTRSRLVLTDVDTLADLYVAKVGGGFESQQAPPPPSCSSGEGCRGEGSRIPAVPSALTPSFSGPGNSAKKPQPRKCGKGKRRVVRNGQARCVKKKSGGNRKRTANKTGRASR